MARGNHVDICVVEERFGIIIIYPESKNQSFKYYHKITISKNGLVMEHWTGYPKYNYKDYLCNIQSDAKLIRRSNGYLFFKTNS